MNTDLFIGRESELADLTKALESAMGGEGRLVAIAGEPGIGKTRLAQKIIKEASGRGCDVLMGQCVEDQGAPAYWPWTLALRSAAASRASPAGLGTELPEPVEDLRLIFPDDPDGGVPSDRDENTFQLFDRVTGFLDELSRLEPLVLLLEDMHWADRSSMRLLEFVNRELPNSAILLVVTYRDIELSRGHPFVRTLAALSRSLHVDRMKLRGLEPWSVGVLMNNLVGEELPQQVIESVASQTQGNPFFVSEIARELATIKFYDESRISSMANASSHFDVKVPDSVKGAIGVRLERLSDECVDALRIAAVIGFDFDILLLERLINDVPKEHISDLLDEALRSDIVEKLPRTDSYRFSHALIQQVLADELSTGRRIRLHAQLVDELENMLGEYSVRSAAALAHHSREAESVLGGEKAFQYSVLAGELALDAHGYDDAERYFRRAIESGKNRPEDGTTAELFSGLGGILTHSEFGSVRQEGWDMLGRAFDLYLRQEEPEKAVRVVQTPVALVNLRGTVDLTHRALELVGQDSLQRGYLLARHAIARKDELGDYEGELHHLEKSLEIAKEHRDQHLEARVMLHFGQHFITVGDHESSLEYCRSTIVLAREGDEPDVEVRACRTGTIACLSMFDLPGAMLLHRRDLELAEKLRIPTTLSFAFEVDFNISRYLGRWTDALDVADREFGRTGNEALHRYRLRLIETCSSSAVPGGTKQHLMGSDSGHLSSEEITLAISAWLFTRDKSDLSLIPAYVSNFDSNYADHQLLRLIAESIYAVASDDVLAIRKYYRNLSKYQEQWDTLGGVPTDHVLGLLASKIGLEDEAVGHFESAILLCRNAGYLPGLVISCCDFADMLAERGYRDGLARAQELVMEVRAIANDLGMQSAIARIAELSFGTPTRYPDGISDREAEILRLVAGGHSNQGIADQLVLSRHTVVRHIANIYAKIDVSNRAEATSYAHRRGIVHEPRTNT